MSLVNFTATPIFRRLAYLRSVFALVRWLPKIKKDNKKRSRERRDFMLELMKSHPEALPERTRLSEHDVRLPIKVLSALGYEV